MASAARSTDWARQGYTFTAVAAAAVFAVACGSSSSSISNSATKSSPTLITRPVDPCLLVKASDASTAIGTTMTGDASTSGTGLCTYRGVAGTNVVSAYVFAQTYPDVATASAVKPDQMAALGDLNLTIQDAKSVSGIGVKAFEYTTTSKHEGIGIVIFVFMSNVVMFIAVTPNADVTKVKALARIAVANLPIS